ncbi:MAG: tetratricopeptide repeat protein [Verrucomicrobiota bacterium]|nr:tetratricopeptide repeat protein [Verrucomicrobiota bacterium]
MNAGNFLSELKRRNVYKVAVAYAVIAWLSIQAASILLPTFEAPPWVMKAFVVIVAAGFVLALVIAWAFEMTPEGMKRTENVRPDEKIPQWSRRQFAALILVVAIVAASLLGYQVFRATPRANSASDVPSITAKSIAVLPFENLSRDPDNAYFTEGIQDEILARLAKIADLKVISRTSTQRYKSSPDDLPQIAKRLGVSNILEGSVQKTGDRVRVTVQLINAASDAHLWAETYDRNLTDVFATESEIARMIADTLRAKLTGSEQNAIAARPTENAEAHQLYLRGRYFWNKRTGADFKKAIGYFNQAIARDPNYALAYAGLSDAYCLLPGYAEADPKNSFPQAKAAAAKALELDSTLGEAHTALANALFAYDLNFAEAEREFRRAIELNPNYATAHQWYAESVLTPLGRFDEAIAEARRALELDPLSVIINADVGTALTSARRYDEAIEQLRKSAELDPGFYYAHWALGNALELKGRNEEAIAEYKKAIGLDNDPLPLALLGHLYAKVGRKDEALVILKQLRERRSASQQQYVSAYNLALIHIGLGQKDEAIQLLEQTYEDRDGYNIGFIKVDPFLDPLRGEPRFEALVQRIFGANK